MVFLQALRGGPLISGIFPYSPLENCSCRPNLHGRSGEVRVQTPLHGQVGDDLGKGLEFCFQGLVI